VSWTAGGTCAHKSACMLAYPVASCARGAAGEEEGQEVAHFCKNTEICLILILSDCRQPKREKPEFLIYVLSVLAPTSHSRCGQSIGCIWPYREPSTVSGADGINQKLGFSPHSLVNTVQTRVFDFHRRRMCMCVRVLGTGFASFKSGGNVIILHLNAQHCTRPVPSPQSATPSLCTRVLLCPLSSLLHTLL
jgi:hypothetical protein